MSTSLLQLPNTGYLAIAARLREQIRDGALAPYAQLPSIGELARRHETTAITVRRALRQLEEEGLVRVEHGVGTFAADWAQSFDLLPSFRADMDARALRSETEVLGRGEDAEHAPAAAALRRPPGEPLPFLDRLRRVEGVPVALQRSYLAREYRLVVEQY